MLKLMCALLACVVICGCGGGGGVSSTNYRAGATDYAGNYTTSLGDTGIMKLTIFADGKVSGSRNNYTPVTGTLQDGILSLNTTTANLTGAVDYAPGHMRATLDCSTGGTWSIDLLMNE